MELKYESSIEKLSREKKVIFESGVKFFYKSDYAPEEIWINKEILVQLNITPKCPLNCSFCYIKNRYNSDLDFNKILKLLNNLEKYYKELGIVYRINLTGGDIFYYYKIEELLELLRDLEYVVAVDPLINRFWNDKTKKILEIIIDKITYIQMNISVIKEEDLEYVKNMKKISLLKYPIYKLSEKKLINKIIDIMKKYDNVLLSFDWIIPQNKEYAKYCYIKDISEGINEARMIIELLKKEKLDDRIFTTSCIIEREIFGRTYLCGIGIQNIYVMPDGKIAICSRYPFLETNCTIDNFDLLEYLAKFQKLISNTCLFENRHFMDFWKTDENPKYW